MTALDTVRTAADVRSHFSGWKTKGLSTGLVPTMGALHDGHLSLVRRLKKEVDRVAVSIFVNPTQFGEGEDFDAYPRDLEGDAAKLEVAGADLIYAPTPAVMYPEGFLSKISVAKLPDHFEGAHRPGHFDGVATVVAKLLLQTGTDAAIFGEKDFQQLAVIRRMATDLDLPVQIFSGAVIRDSHGLALSSRNAYLDTDQLAIARQLNVILKTLAAEAPTSDDLRALEKTSVHQLISAGFSAVDYVSIIDPVTLDIVDSVQGEARVVATARLANIRLLDNMAIKA